MKHEQDFVWTGAGWTPGPFVKSQSQPKSDPTDEQIAEITDEAITRDWRWLLNGSIGIFRWWLRIGRAEKEVAARRLSICQGCEYFGEGIRCGKCGCKFRAKVTDERGSCPIGKW